MLCCPLLQVVQTALSEAQDAEDVSVTVKAFMTADRLAQQTDQIAGEDCFGEFCVL